MRTDLGWSLDPSIAFLNHGSYGACPEPVLAAHRAWRDRLLIRVSAQRYVDASDLDRLAVALGRRLAAA